MIRGVSKEGQDGITKKTIMTLEEYFRLDNENQEARYEYIDGSVTMLAGGTLNHATIATNTIITLGNLLRGGSCRVFTSDARVQLDKQRYVYPDVTVSCDPADRGQGQIIQSPRLVIEILSPGTEGYDRGRKLAYYRDCPSIQEYMLINSQFPEVEIYRREGQAWWSYGAFHSGDRIELRSIGQSFPIEGLYENVLFSTDEG